MLILITRWAAARRIQRLFESERGPLSALLLEAAMHLEHDRTAEAAAALSRLETLACGMQDGLDMETLQRVAVESEIQEELIDAATARYMAARRRRLRHESGKNGPLRQLVMAAGAEIEAGRPTRAWVLLDAFDGACAA